MGEYIKPELVAKAKQMDLLTYLRLARPDELVHKGKNHYTTKSHDSVDISNGLWKRWSTEEAGKSAVDYLIKVEKLSFQDAVKAVTELTGLQTWDARPADRQPQQQKEFLLPIKNEDNRLVIEYLKGRGIHTDVIDFCIQKGYLYEDKKRHNAVFVGYDNGQAKYAFLRGTQGDFKGDAYGSNKKYSFHIAETKDAKILNVYECAIDLLSYCSLCRLVNFNWKKHLHLSQGGISGGLEGERIGSALEEFLDKNPCVQKVYLRYDNDQKGYEAAVKTQRILQQKYSINAEIKLPHHGKDYNEYLQDILQKLQNPTVSSPLTPSLQVEKNTGRTASVKSRRQMR